MKLQGTFQQLCVLFDRTDRLQAAGLLVMMIGGAALEMLAVSMLAPLIESLASPEVRPSTLIARALHNVLQTSSHGSFVFSLLTLLVVLYIVKNLFFAVLFYLQNRFGFAKQNKLSERLFSLYLRLPYTFHLQRNTADLLRNLTHETDQVVWTVVLPALTILTEALIASGLALLLFYTNPQAACVILTVFGLIGFIYYRLFRDRQERWGETRMRHDGLRIRAIHEALHGLKEIKVLGRQAYFLRDYAQHNRQRASAHSKQNLVLSSNLLLLEVLGVSSLLILVGLHLAQGRTFETILPLMGLFAGAAFRLIPASNRIINSFQQIRYAGPIIQTLCDELSRSAEPLPAIRQSTPFQKDIHLEALSYAYPGARGQVFSELSMTISRGEMIGLIGASGVGKTTLIELLLGILTPTHGHIRVDGQDVQDNLGAWQRQIGYIAQNVHLMDGSIRQNVAFAIHADEIDEGRVVAALKDAQLAAFVQALPRGLDTPIGELGKQLSGGQRQRIGIARALYHDPAFLILDEATSSLDQETEAEVMQAIERLAGNKTMLVISHRLQSILACHRVYELGPQGLQEIDRQMLTQRTMARS